MPKPTPDQATKVITEVLGVENLSDDMRVGLVQQFAIADRLATDFFFSVACDRANDTTVGEFRREHGI